MRANIQRSPPLGECGPIPATEPNGLRTALRGLGKFALWAMASAGAAQSPALAGGPAPAAPPTVECATPAQTVGGADGLTPSEPCLPPGTAGPAAWGVIGVTGYATGSREAPNGFSFDPLVGLDSDLNFGLLPDKQLYLFLQNGFWVQRTAATASGKSQRELDANFGLAWNYFDSLELRVWGYSLNNLNRGTSPASPNGYKDGLALENRYYFGLPYNYPVDAYDIGRLSFVGLGYYPTKDLVGNNGQSFRPGLFVHGYATADLPTPFRSYLYGGAQMTAQDAATPRLVDLDMGLAIRPLADRQSLEFRIGDKLVDDLQAHMTKNLVYGAVRLAFGTGQPSGGAGGASAGDLGSWSWPEAWGVVGLPVYATGSHMGPNGVPFTPIFAITSELNLGLMPKKELYVFWDGTFWGQHSGAGITNTNQGSFDFSKREMDSELGLAWNFFDSFELRGSVYALNNLNRGISLTEPAGGKQGVRAEGRYYFSTADPYDVGRSSYIGVGYLPTEDLVGGNGASFRPGPFAHAYLARDLPIPWFESYVYADMQATARQTSALRLFETDAGWAIRPFRNWQNLEFRVGDNLTADVEAAATRNVVYGAVRLQFGPSGFTRLSP